MSECMGTGKPRIAILMAVYEPRLDWLREQLLSLNQQTYPNLMLYVRDDGSPTVPFEVVQSCVRECVTAFPYTIQRNETNLGSNLTFERLTEEAEGDYFAYCDQDDVWNSEKLARLEEEMERTQALLICSDVTVIDGQGKTLADSITKVRRRHVFQSGSDLANGLIYRNFVIGCTMLIRAPAAKHAIPFLPSMVHDHYLALCCAVHGEICSIPTPLVQYRLHGENQTSVLAGVRTKEEYYEQRILQFDRRAADIHRRFPELEMERTLEWARARKAYYEGKPNTGRRLWHLRQENLSTTMFELVMLRMPAVFFRGAIRLIQRGVV